MTGWMAQSRRRWPLVCVLESDSIIDASAKILDVIVIVGVLKLTQFLGMEDLVSPGDEFLQYGVANNGESLAQALLDLEEYIEEEGPFDGLMAFSQGAGFGATYLIRQSQQGVAPAFRFAVFFCGAAAQDPCAPFTDNGQKLDGVIKIPTAHIWGKNDELWHFGPALSQSCLGSVKEEYIHDGGHEIPGPRDPIRLARAVQAVQRTISRAQYAQG